MRSVFWLALGATTAVLVVRQLRRTAEGLTPPALLAGLTETARAFGAEVRAGMAEREAELRTQLGLSEADGAPGSAS